MPALNFVFLGIKGSVIALDDTTGAQIWATRLKGSDFVNLILTENRLYAATKGEIFSLDPGTGKILWQNPLAGMGRGLACIAAPGGQPNMTAAVKHKQKQDDAATATAAS
jgi:outer membrane protein assembly factor BamB